MQKGLRAILGAAAATCHTEGRVIASVHAMGLADVAPCIACADLHVPEVMIELESGHSVRSVDACIQLPGGLNLHLSGLLLLGRAGSATDLLGLARSEVASAVASHSLLLPGVLGGRRPVGRGEDFVDEDAVDLLRRGRRCFEA